MSNTADSPTHDAERDAVTGFRDIDRTGDVGHYIRLVECQWSRPVMPAQTPQLRPDAGQDRRSGARRRTRIGRRCACAGGLLGYSGRAVGMDVSETMIAEARKRSEGTGLSIEFAAGDARRLDFADNGFDACRTERALEQLAGPTEALTELVRVTRSGGRILALEPDRETTFMSPGDKAVTRGILNAYADGYASGWIGPQLMALFVDAGLAEVTVVPEAMFFRELELVSQILVDAHLAKVKKTILLPPRRLMPGSTNWSTPASAARFCLAPPCSPSSDESPE